MPNYKESVVVGDSWVRARRVVVENPIDETPAISFIEEQIINLPEQAITQSAGNVSEPFTPDNAQEQFSLLNPETGEVVGTATYQDVYVALHSLYYHVAAKRDAAQQQSVEAE